MTLRPVIFGEVLWDQFPDGASALGGAPFNVAWHLQAFGARPLFISRIGEDPAGQRIVDAMTSWGMDLDGLQRDPERPTGAVQVSFDNGEPAYTIVHPAAWDGIDARSLPSEDGGLLYHGSLALRSPTSRQALQALRQRNDYERFVDVNLRPPWWQADILDTELRGTRWVKLNGEELRTLTGSGEPTSERAIETFLSRYQPQWLLLTLGERGAVAIDTEGRRETIAPQPQSTTVDTVGAGDAFASVILLGLLHDWPMALCLQRAQSFASAVVGLRGATCQRNDFYRPFLAQWQL